MAGLGQGLGGEESHCRQGIVGQGCGHFVDRRTLEFPGAKITMQRHVERIEPQHRRIAIVAMFVPAPGRGQDQVAIFHRAGLAIDQRDRSAAFQHEPQRPHRMPVRPRGFAREQALHAGQHPDPVTGARAVPIYQTTSYVFRDVDHAASLFNLEVGGHIYSRISNPTVAVFEERVAALEEGSGALAVSSGQAALHIAIATLMGAGGHIVASTSLYGGTRNMLGLTLPRFGIESSFVHPGDHEGFRKAIKPNTRLVLGETIGNPGGEVLDIPAIAAIAHEATRVSAVSARLVSTIGARAPSTTPAVSALARYSSCLASMLPASRSGTTNMSALPATGDTILIHKDRTELITPCEVWPMIKIQIKGVTIERPAILNRESPSATEWCLD